MGFSGSLHKERAQDFSSHNASKIRAFLMSCRQQRDSFLSKANNPSLHVFIGHLYFFFGEMSILVFCPLFDWVVCFSDIELLIYSEINPLSVASFADIFSCSEGCLSSCWQLYSELLVFMTSAYQFGGWAQFSP